MSFEEPREKKHGKTIRIWESARISIEISQLDGDNSHDQVDGMVLVCPLMKKLYIIQFNSPLAATANVDWVSLIITSDKQRNLNLKISDPISLTIGHLPNREPGPCCGFLVELVFTMA